MYKVKIESKCADGRQCVGRNEEERIHGARKGRAGEKMGRL